jgi:hypothetical protein
VSKLSRDEIEYIVENFDDSRRVIKRVIGGEVLHDTLEGGGAAVVRLYDLEVDYLDIGARTRPRLVTRSRESLMVLTRQDIRKP